MLIMPALVNANPIPVISEPSIEIVSIIFVNNLLFNFFVGLSGFSLFNVNKVLKKYFLIVFSVTLIGVLTGYFAVLSTYGSFQSVYGVVIPHVPFIAVTLMELILFTLLFSAFRVFNLKQSFLIGLLIVSLGLIVGVVSRATVMMPITPLSGT